MPDSLSLLKNRSFRFSVLVVIVPLVLAVSAWTVGFTIDGDITTNGRVLAVGFITAFGVVHTLILSVTEQFRTDLHRRAPLPLAFAAAGASATIALAAFGSSMSSIIAFGVAGCVAGLAAVVAHLTVRAALTPVVLPTVTSPAPADVLRGDVPPGRTPVWSGRAPAHPRRAINRWVGFYLLFGTALLAFTPSLDDRPARDLVFVGAVAILQAIFVPARFSAGRVRVTIGPAGIIVRSGLSRFVHLTTPLTNVASAWYTDAPRPNLASSWGKQSSSRRLSFVTREGPALLVRFTDGTDLVVSMDDPAEPAAVLNQLLDRRPALAADDAGSTC